MEFRRDFRHSRLLHEDQRQAARSCFEAERGSRVESASGSGAPRRWPPCYFFFRMRGGPHLPPSSNVGEATSHRERKATPVRRSALRFGGVSCERGVRRRDVGRTAAAAAVAANATGARTGTDTTAAAVAGVGGDDVATLPRRRRRRHVFSFCPLGHAAFPVSVSEAFISGK